MKISNIKKQGLLLGVQISNTARHPLFAGSMVMVVGSNLFNFGQFIYHFLAGRMLGKVYYGDVAAIIAILALVGIVQLSLNLAVVKFVAVEKTRGFGSRLLLSKDCAMLYNFFPTNSANSARRQA